MQFLLSFPRRGALCKSPLLSVPSALIHMYEASVRIQQDNPQPSAGTWLAQGLLLPLPHKASKEPGAVGTPAMLPPGGDEVGDSKGSFSTIWTPTSGIPSGR